MTDRSEKAIVNAALVEVSALPRTMVWRNNTGMAWQGDKLPTRVGQTVVVKPGMVVLLDARPITFGLPGSADLLGASGGRPVALEGKRRLGKQAEQQQRFQDAWERAGGLYGVFRSEAEAVAIVRRG